MDLADYVLGKFTKDSQKTMEEAINKSADAVMELIKSGVEASMQKYN